jgi:hypothetical protein
LTPILTCPECGRATWKYCNGKGTHSTRRGIPADSEEIRRREAILYRWRTRKARQDAVGVLALTLTLGAK